MATVGAIHYKYTPTLMWIDSGVNLKCAALLSSSRGHHGTVVARCFLHPWFFFFPLEFRINLQTHTQTSQGHIPVCGSTAPCCCRPQHWLTSFSGSAVVMVVSQPAWRHTGQSLYDFTPISPNIKTTCLILCVQESIVLLLPNIPPAHTIDRCHTR